MSNNIPRRLGNYWLDELLGSGYSGSIFRAYNVYTGDCVALKVQDVNHECPTNRYEEYIYPLLQGAEGMPTLWASGVQGKWHYLVISLLGASLENIYRKSGKRAMDLRSVCSIAIQVITRLQTMHNREVLHRDIQLGNCVVGRPPNETTIYMIDFGFSKRYIDPYSRRHIPDSKVKREFLGNYWFTSVGVHCKGKVPSRRDDLEAAALMFIHLLTPGGLPWTRNGVPKTEEQHRRIKCAKEAARPEDLCRGMPSEFEEFLRYCRRLKFSDQPDYERWIDEFRELARENGFTDIDKFIWPPPPLQTKPAQLRSLDPPRPAVTPSEMENVLHDLAKLKLNNRPILAERTNNCPPQLDKPPQGFEKKTEVIDLSGDASGGSTEPGPPQKMILRTPVRVKKATRLEKLRLSVLDATNNVMLSSVIAEFSIFLKETGSKTLTREGFAFLDALYKQLADPSVFAQPMRTRSSVEEASGGSQPAHVKLGVVARLRREVATAQSNRMLAKLVADFGVVTNKSSTRTITKDGFAFLDGLAARLKMLQ
ncbi:kinase-like domain-containing protein [Pisolithus tinctorius]|nr:kinase-like domain-containing protein [Pisolithus tinctorius]